MYVCIVFVLQFFVNWEMVSFEYHEYPCDCQSKYSYTGSKADFIYLFIYYNTITNIILIRYELSNFDHVLCVMSQTRVFGGNRTHDPHVNSLAHYPLDYQGTDDF